MMLNLLNSTILKQFITKWAIFVKNWRRHLNVKQLYYKARQVLVKSRAALSYHKLGQPLLQSDKDWGSFIKKSGKVGRLKSRTVLRSKVH